MLFRSIAAVALAASAGIGYAAGAANGIPDVSTLNATAMKLVIPDLDKVKWGPAAGLEGTDSYTLVGDPAKPGLYIVLNKFKPGNFSRPHFHPNDRHITVVKGTWNAGANTFTENAGGADSMILWDTKADATISLGAIVLESVTTVTTQPALTSPATPLIIV